MVIGAGANFIIGMNATTKCLVLNHSTVLCFFFYLQHIGNWTYAKSIIGVNAPKYVALDHGIVLCFAGTMQMSEGHWQCIRFPCVCQPPEFLDGKKALSGVHVVNTLTFNCKLKQLKELFELLNCAFLV